MLGFTAAFAAYGSFFIPKLFGWSVQTTGSYVTAVYIFIAFYVVAILLNWLFYQSKRAEITSFVAAKSAGEQPAIATHK